MAEREEAESFPASAWVVDEGIESIVPVETGVGARDDGG
jgi:hypothetical protein